MAARMLTTDEAIINEYHRLFNEMGSSKECFHALKSLSRQICPERQAQWQPILEGLQYSLRGDGFELPTPYNHTEHYLRASELFAEAAEKIADKNSLLFAFVERERITALALSRTQNLEELISLLDKNIINKFKDTNDSGILTQAAVAMLEKSVVLWEVNKDNITKDILQQVKEIEEAMIQTFSASEIPAIQAAVAKCLNNQTSTIEKECEINEKKSNEKRDELIKLFGNTQANNLKIQVSRAMLDKATSLEELYAIEQVRRFGLY